MGAKFTICCCHYYLKHNQEERNAILRMRTTSRPPEQLSSGSSDSETQEKNIFGPPPSKMSQWNNRQSQKSAADQWTIAKRPDDSPIRQGLDGELEALISMRDQTDEATEEWEKLNYDIHALRYAKREVRARWKKILLQLGYQCEVDALLCVHKQNRFSRDEEHLKKATELLAQLLNHTSLFPCGMGHQNQYLCIMDRLVLLDSAEDFVRLAKEKYPMKDERQ